MNDLATLANLEPAAAVASPQFIKTLPVLVLFPHNRCNCRCVMCDIWRIKQAREITAHDLEPHLASLRALRVRWVVFSGGEPQMHSDLANLSRWFRAEGIRVTLLTAGLLLESQAASVAEAIDDLIVSLDGPPEIHDRIRRVPRAFARLANGVAELRRLRPEIQIRARSTVQRLNHLSLRSIVQAAKDLRLNSVSFLAADVTSTAFNRPQGWTNEQQEQVALNGAEVDRLEQEIEALIGDYSDAIATGYVAENAEKLRRIVLHFRAQLGQRQAVAPRCNAPWVSSVIEADGTVRPCFFHAPIGNIHEKPIAEILNGDQAMNFRRTLNVATNPICQKCVCSLYLAQESETRSELSLRQVAGAGFGRKGNKR